MAYIMVTYDEKYKFRFSDIILKVKAHLWIILTGMLFQQIWGLQSVALYLTSPKVRVTS